MYWTALKFKMFETCHYIINKRANKYKKNLGETHCTLRHDDDDEKNRDTK